MMDLTGRLCEVSRDYKSKKPMVKFIINEEPNGIDDLADKDLKIKVSRASNPRSLDANAYFHVLCDKLRQKLGVSMARCKTDLITSYGQIEYLEEGVPLYYKTNASIDYVMELEAAHMKFVRMSDDLAYIYKVYRGSHTYNTYEMHQLLEGTIEECKLHGIETKTPDEIARLEAIWAMRKGEEDEYYRLFTDRQREHTDNKR
jgi:hypothetical protein